MSEVAAPSGVRLRALPAWIWPHVCDLDAPLIAVVWQLLFYRNFQVAVVPAATLLLGLTVWLIYAADRLLDSRQEHGQRTRRHLFHREHKAIFTGLMLVVFSTTLALLQFLPERLLYSGLVLAALLFLYFLVVQAGGTGIKRWFPKEYVVGILFAAGTCVAPASARGTATNLFPSLLFAALCTTNCMAIKTWEAGRVDIHLRPAWWILAAGSLALLMLHSEARYSYAALLISALGLLWLDSEKDRFSPDLLRVLADLPLFSPLLYLAFR